MSDIKGGAREINNNTATNKEEFLFVCNNQVVDLSGVFKLDWNSGIIHLILLE